MTRVPIRWRLTLWYAGFFTVALLLLGGALHVGLRDRLYETLDEQVAAQEAIAQAAIQLDDAELGLVRNLTLLDDDAFIRLLDLDGDIVAQRGEEFYAVPIAPAAFVEGLSGSTSISTVEVDDDMLRLMTTPVRQDNRVVGVLHVGLESDDVEETLDDVLSLLTIAAPIVLVLAIGGGYLLAGRALAPVTAITNLAGRISERDLHARLDLDLPDDEIGRLARTFNGMLARIENGFERERRFTGDAAHELRTPLGLMRSQVDLALARPRSAAAYREALQGFDTDLERLIKLVGSLLTLARADTGQLSVERAPFDLEETIGLVLEQYEPVATEHGITLQNQASAALLVADEGLLIQVLVNLLDNAITHTPTGGRVTVGCERAADQVRLWVVDTGSGIAPEHREWVFDRFYRVDTGRAREVGGTGLGLAITKVIVEAHGGTIFLSDQAEPGTHVELVLPAAS